MCSKNADGISSIFQANSTQPNLPPPVFSRCHGNAPLRLSQNHHVEDEVIHSSTFLSSGQHSPDTRYLIPSFSSLLASLAAGCIILWALACLCCACRLLLGGKWGQTSSLVTLLRLLP